VFTDEEEYKRDRVVVLAHEFWLRRFGGDRTVVGRAMTLNGAAHLVVGVMPPRFKFPDGNSVDLYSPLSLRNEELTTRRSHLLMVIGRLSGRATLDGAQADLATIARRIADQDRTSNPEVTLAAAHDVLVEDVRLALMILFGTVGLVLLIACANVANLLLVRASSRRREMAMRAALGAGRGRLVRQVLTESIVLALMGGTAGTFVAWWLVEFIRRFQPPNVPRVDQVGIDATVLLYVTAATFATGVIFGLIPAFQAMKPRLSEATSRTSETAPTRNRARSALVVTEVAISLMLLAGAGLMLRSFFKLQRLDHGFEPDKVLTAQLLLPFAKYPVDTAQYRPLKTDAGPVPDGKPFVFFAQVEERLKGVPGIESVGAVSALPLNPVGVDYDLPVVVVGRPQARAGEEPQADFRTATTGYFRTLRIPLRSGREFNEFDGPNSAPVAIINEALARQQFPNENPLGQRLMLYGRSREIVGVVGAVRHHGFRQDARPEMILPYRQFQFSAMTLAVRSSLEQGVLETSISQAVRESDSQLPVYRVRSMNEFLSDSVAHPRFTTLLIGAFAAVALILALVGVYGVTSHAVNQRAREVAVRIALGARRGEVVRLVARQSLHYVLVGVVLGFAGAVIATKFMAGLLFGVSATDPFTFVGASVALSFTALAGTYIPALRAARVAPAMILRGE
jgi:putative ABC transport system permease protein